MHLAYQASILVSITAFFSYGVGCLLADGMAAEFERFGLARFRRLTGALEIAGAVGLAGGYLFPPLTVAASGGLALLMALGVVTRLRVRDPWFASLPALLLLVVNGFIFAVSLGLLDAMRS